MFERAKIAGMNSRFLLKGFEWELDEAGEDEDIVYGEVSERVIKSLVTAFFLG